MKKEMEMLKQKQKLKQQIQKIDSDILRNINALTYFDLEIKNLQRLKLVNRLCKLS